MFLHIPVANIFQCFSIQMLFWVSCYRLDKKICICPSLTQAVSITDTKYWRPKMRHFSCLNFNLEASFINLMGHKNVGKSVVNSKICFTFGKIMLKSPTFWPFFSTNLSQKHKMFFKRKWSLAHFCNNYFLIQHQISQNVKKSWQHLELVSKSYNFFLIFPIFHFSGVLPKTDYEA